jgi:hypothetical protein
MNYFFGIIDGKLKCKLTIPKFQNSGVDSEPQDKYKLFKIYIAYHKWKIEEVECEQDKYFFYVSNDDFKNTFFFLAERYEINKFKENNYEQLLSLNNFTHTVPKFRANIRISNSFGGFSSYQGEYPYYMVIKGGNIICEVSTLANQDADYNKMFLPNIYKEPIKDKFECFIVDIVSKKILSKKEFYTNSVNEIDIEKNFIYPNVFIFTRKHIGAPLFVSSKNNHLSFEHTHPPHEFVMFSGDKTERVAKLKKEVDDIIS